MGGYDEGVDDIGSTSADDSTTEDGQGYDPSSKIDEAISRMDANFQKLVGQWGNKIGQLTNSISQSSNGGASNAEPSEDLLSRLVERPDAFVQEQVSSVLTKQAQQRQEQASKRNAFISEVLPDFNEVRGDMIQSIVSDGVPQHQADQILESLDNSQLNAIYRRAKAEAENRTLKRTLEAMKKRGVDLSDPSLQAAGRGSTGGSLDSADDPTAGLDLRKMSPEARQKLYSKYLANKQR